MDENDDALVIAMWCWPGFDPNIHGVLDAERVLIERGHKEAYGKALAHALLVDSPFIDRTSCGARDVWWRCAGEDLTHIATAPLAARVKAMAAVIRSMKEAR